MRIIIGTEYLQWDAALKAGDQVIARWTSCYSSYSIPAVVVRVNRASVRVRTAKEIILGGRLILIFPAGHEITLPRSGFHSGAAKWSVNNGVFPVDASK